MRWLTKVLHPSLSVQAQAPSSTREVAQLKRGRHTCAPDLGLTAVVTQPSATRRQETPHCASVSFERHAANAFQAYVAGALNFSIKRGGLLYGSMGEGGHVRVDAIFEPPQARLPGPGARADPHQELCCAGRDARRAGAACGVGGGRCGAAAVARLARERCARAQEGSADRLQLERGTEQERRADFLAEHLGCAAAAADHPLCCALRVARPSALWRPAGRAACARLPLSTAARGRG